MHYSGGYLMRMLYFNIDAMQLNVNGLLLGQAIIP